MKKSLLLPSVCVLFTVSCLLYFGQAHAKQSSFDSISNADRASKRINQIIESPVLKDFDVWVGDYLNGKIGDDSESIRLGEVMAAKRRDYFKELMELAPKQAIEKAIADENSIRLPSSIIGFLEHRISAYSDFHIYMSDGVDLSSGNMTGSQVERQVVIGSSRFKAFVYGRRIRMTTKLQIPLQGVILDDVMAIDEVPSRVLEPREYESRAVDLDKLNESTVVAEIGGTIGYFSSQAELESFDRGQIDWESRIGPEFQNGGSRPSSSWTIGPKKVLVIRVDFSDKPGVPLDPIGAELTPAFVQGLMDNDVNPFFVNTSYNQTSLQTTVTTTVLRMRKSLSYYEANRQDILSDGESVAIAAGYDPNEFDREIIVISYDPNLVIGISVIAGEAELGGKKAYINGRFLLRYVGHELGHTYGLVHADGYYTDDGSVIGHRWDVNEINPDMSDTYCMMGTRGPSITMFHFNARYKRLLDWLTDNNVQTITSNGIVRVFAQDSPTSGGIRAIKIRKNDAKNYWIEFRQLMTDRTDAMNGAIVRWDYVYNNNYVQTELLDMSPSVFSPVNSALVIGQSFYDNENHIRISPLGKGNTTPESLDVRVQLKSSSPPDFDNDGKADLSFWRDTNGVWYVTKSSNNTISAFQFGTIGDKIVPGDYDGDGKTDYAVWRPSTGNWYIQQSSAGFAAVQFGLSTDLPAQGDFDGDGKTDVAIFRPSTGIWYLQQSTEGFGAVQFGLSDDKPVAGDYDGDGKTDIAVYRPSEGNWYQLRSSEGFAALHFGISIDKVVPADYDGDGKTDVAVYRDGAPGVWYRLQSTAGYSSTEFGTTNDIPVAGDFDGDGLADISVFAPSSGTWARINSSNSTPYSTQFGQSSDKPVPSGYVPIQ